MHKSYRTGFTLIELLIVIGIVAVLSAVAVLTLNPTELLKQARDSRRLTDLATINKALSIYQADTGAGTLGTPATVYVSVPDPTATSTLGTNCTSMGLPVLPSGYAYHCAASSTFQNVDGTGWIPVNLTQMSTKSPLGTFPVDPTNTTTSGRYYTFVTGADPKQWEDTTVFESAKDQPIAVNDGDGYPGVYRAGPTIGVTPGIRDRNLVGYWTFDDVSTTSAKNITNPSMSVDLTSNWSPADLHVTGYNSPKAVHFDGVDDAAFLTGWEATMNKMTFAAWVNQGASSAFAPLFVRWATGTTRWYVYLNNTAPSFGIPGTFEDTSNYATPLGTWTHIAVTYDPSASLLAYYVNGTQVATSSRSAPISFENHGPVKTAFALPPSPSSLGYSSYNDSYANVTMDDVRVYDRALSGSEIAAIYQGTK